VKNVKIKAILKGLSMFLQYYFYMIIRHNDSIDKMIMIGYIIDEPIGDITQEEYDERRMKVCY